MEGLEGGIRYSDPNTTPAFPVFHVENARGVYGRARLPKDLTVFAKRIHFAIRVVKLGRWRAEPWARAQPRLGGSKGVARLFDENHKSR